MSMTFTPPLLDMRFVLRHVADISRLATMPGYEHADAETVDGILDEAGRFFSEQFAPLNRVGDVQHSLRLDDGIHRDRKSRHSTVGACLEFRD